MPREGLRRMHAVWRARTSASAFRRARLPWSSTLTSSKLMPTREEVMAKKAAEARAQKEAQAQAAAAAAAEAQAQKEAEAAEQAENQASTAEIIMSDYSMSFLPCVIFLFIIVVAIFAATLGAFWVPNFLF